MNKKELLELSVKSISLYYKLNDEDKKTFKKDFDNIDKILEKIYNKITERG
jgi:hypothetical protein